MRQCEIDARADIPHRDEFHMGRGVTPWSGRPVYGVVTCAAFGGQSPPKPVWKRWAKLKYRVQPRLSQEGMAIKSFQPVFVK